MNMLLVEDDERIVRFMKRGLEAEQWTVRHVRNRQELKQVFLQCPMHFAICDIFLGDESGLELCKHIRRHYPLMPILMVTAKDSPSLANECIAVGANGFLLKPFSFDDLLTQICKLMPVNPTNNDGVRKDSHLSIPFFNNMQRSFTP